MIEQLSGWLGTVGLLLGAFLLFRKRIVGFLFYAVGALFYLVQGLLMSNWPLVTLNVVFMIMNFASWLIWMRKPKDV